MSAAFQSEILPEECQLIGYSWLLEYYKLDFILRELCCVSAKRLPSQRVEKGAWTIFDTQLQVQNDPFKHLEFCLKHEHIDLLLLKNIFKAFNREEILSYLRVDSKKILRKKIWFLYEFLLDVKLPIDDLPAGKYDDLLDSKKYIVLDHPIKSKRHKVNNNLLGVSAFVSIIKRTPSLQHYMKKNLGNEVVNMMDTVPSSIMRRAASFLLLSDSKASFEIEGERPPKNRIESWGKIINEAGKTALSVQEIERLHAILLQDSRFTKIGLRDEGVFLGDRDRDNEPIPEFIGAKSEDLERLIESWLALDALLSKEQVDPILHAVIIAFSFVYIHPLEDGNGRIHRYLIHHVLARRGLYPKGMIFPISNVILDEIEKYRDILVSHTSALMHSIEWESTSTGNVKVTNETSDLYRFFDCTLSSEFIYACVDKTIKETLPQELHYLTSFDQAYTAVNEIIEMPDNKIKTLITLILQNSGTLSKNKRDKYFDLLSDNEIKKIESIVNDSF